MSKIGESNIFGYKLLIYKSGKKNFRISVSSEKEIIFKTPINISYSHIFDIITKKKSWILKQINKSHKFYSKNPEPKFKNGQIHKYLGKDYVLIVKKSQTNSILLSKNQIFIENYDISQKNIKEFLYSWYLEQAKVIFPKIYEFCWKNFSEKEHYQPPILKIKKVKTIWGSLSSLGNMTINLELIKYNKDCIKYIIFHELCHLKHKNHGPSFKKLLNLQMPNQKDIQKMLKEN